MRLLGRRMNADERGSVTVELALLAPILATMVIGVIDVSLAYGQKLELEQGAQRAIEKIMQTTGDTTVADTLKEEVVCQVNGVDGEGACKTDQVAAADVTVGYRLECLDDGGNRTEQEAETAADFDALTCESDEREVRYVNVTVVDTYTPMFPISWGTGGDGDYDLSATAGVRTQ